MEVVDDLPNTMLLARFEDQLRWLIIRKIEKGTLVRHSESWVLLKPKGLLFDRVCSGQEFVLDFVDAASLIHPSLGFWNVGRG